MAPRLEGLELLRSTGLSPSELEHLARQGFVSTEHTVRNGRRIARQFKLRWREEGRQKVLYLGRNPELAKQVAAAVAFLQQPRRLARKTSTLLRSASRQLRHSKQHLASAVADLRLYFHGSRLRRRRASAKPPTRKNGGPSPFSPEWLQLGWMESQHTFSENGVLMMNATMALLNGEIDQELTTEALLGGSADPIEDANSSPMGQKLAHSSSDESPQLAEEPLPDARTLQEYANEIAVLRTGLAESIRTGVMKAVQIGRLLQEARRLCPRGAWSTWLHDNCGFSSRTARSYMQLARRYTEADAQQQQDLVQLGLRGALEAVARRSRAGTHPRHEQSPSQAILDGVTRLQQWIGRFLADRGLDQGERQLAVHDALAQLRGSIDQLLEKTACQ